MPRLCSQAHSARDDRVAGQASPSASRYVVSEGRVMNNDVRRPTVSRRHLLRLIGLTATASLLAACAPIAAPTPTTAPADSKPAAAPPASAPAAGTAASP